MLNSLTNKKLGAIFGVLLAIVLLFFVMDGDKSERTFREVLVDIDTSAVTAIKIYPKTTNHNEVHLFQQNDQWNVTLENGKTSAVTDQKIKGLLDQLLTIKPKRLASRNVDKWNDMQVDTTGTRVVVLEGSDETLDIVLGRFTFKQPRSMSTFVRLSADSDVYEVDGFLDMTFNQNANSFRDGTVTNDDFNNWSRLSFAYPSDSSFQLSKQGDNWFANNSQTDSLTTVSALRQLAKISGSEFIDGVEVDQLGNPTHKLTIDSEKLGEITVEGFYQNAESMMIRSSQNPESLLDGTKNNLFNKIFVGQSKFYKK